MGVPAVVSVQIPPDESITEESTSPWNNELMRVLFDIAHPAHVHFYRYMIQSLDEAGHAWRIVSRDKDVTNQLLDDMGLEYTSVGQPGTNWGGLATELLARDRALLRVSKEFRPDLILTRNPAGTHVGRLLGVQSIFDTDNGRSAGIHYWSSAPFASVITTPDCFPNDLGRKQLRYPSYKPLAFLHPHHFTPDPHIRANLGVTADTPVFLIRLVSMSASHDRGETGLNVAQVRQIVDLLSPRGRVFVSSEIDVPADIEELALPTRSAQFHHVLATAKLCIGDSGSVIQESAVLGTPSIFISSFDGRVAPIVELEHRYGVVRSYRPKRFPDALNAIREWSDAEDDFANAIHEQILHDKVDLTDWYLKLLGRRFDRSRKTFDRMP